MTSVRHNKRASPNSTIKTSRSCEQTGMVVMAMRGGEGTWWLPLDPFGWTAQAVSYLSSNHQRRGRKNKGVTLVNYWE